jgi:hypothetical protein
VGPGRVSGQGDEKQTWRQHRVCAMDGVSRNVCYYVYV